MSTSRSLLLAVAAGLLAACSGGGTSITAPTPDASGAAVCATLVAALPTDLTAQLRSRATQPSSPYVRAWGTSAATVVLTCGTPRPEKQTDLTQSVVNGLAWGSPVDDSALFRTRDRSVQVTLRIPDGVLPFDVLAGVSSVVLANDPVDPAAAASASPSPAAAPTG